MLVNVRHDEKCCMYENRLGLKESSLKEGHLSEVLVRKQQAYYYLFKNVCL